MQVLHTDIWLSLHCAGTMLAQSCRTHSQSPHTSQRQCKMVKYINTHCQCFSLVQVVHTLLCGVRPLNELQAKKERCAASVATNVVDNEDILGRQVEGRESPSGGGK